MIRASLVGPVLVLLTVIAACDRGDDDRDTGTPVADTVAVDTAADDDAEAEPAGPAPRAAEIRAPREACRGAYDEAACLDGVEALNLSQVPGRVRVTDSLLAVRTEAGWVRFRDRDSAADERIRHLFAGQFADGRYAVVEQRTATGTDYALVDWTSGDTTMVIAAPLPSPDGRFFVVAERDREGVGGPNLIEIWAYGEAAPRKQWSCEAGYGYGPDDVRWNGGGLHFVWMNRNEDYVLAIASRDPSGGWTVDRPPPGTGAGACGPTE
jgi:hypothetical protein